MRASFDEVRIKLVKKPFVCCKYEPSARPARQQPSRWNVDKRRGVAVDDVEAIALEELRRDCPSEPHRFLGAPVSVPLERGDEWTDRDISDSLDDPLLGTRCQDRNLMTTCQAACQFERALLVAAEVVGLYR